MPIDFRQTDTNSSFAVAKYCASQTPVNTQTSNKSMVEGGTAGVTAVSITQDVVVNGINTIAFSTPANSPGLTSWASGDWTVRWEITTANMSVEMPEVAICRLSSAGANLASVGVLVPTAVSFGTVGVKTLTVTGSAQTASSTDRINVGLNVRNTNSMATQVWGFTPSQLISSPLNLPVAARPIRLMPTTQARHRAATR